MVRNFERELNESIKKTRLLKKLIQQKILLEIEESNLSKMSFPR